MWPWGHLAFAYVLYSGVVHLRYRRGPAWPGIVLVALGSQTPDLIDKPLAWTLNVLPSGRSLGHSFLVGTVVVFVAVALLRRYRLKGWPFALGYYSHLLGDSIRPLLDGRIHDLAFLLWPFFEPETTGTGPPRRDRSVPTERAAGRVGAVRTRPRGRRLRLVAPRRRAGRQTPVEADPPSFGSLGRVVAVSGGSITADRPHFARSHTEFLGSWRCQSSFAIR